MPYDVLAEQVIEHMAAVGCNGYAGADLTQFLGLFIDGDLKTGLLQGKRSCQTAEARADNEYVRIFHTEKRRITFSQVRIVR